VKHYLRGAFVLTTLVFVTCVRSTAGGEYREPSGFSFVNPEGWFAAAGREAETMRNSLVMALMGLALPARADDNATEFSTSIDEFRRLSPTDQRSLLRSAFERRLLLAKNIHYEALLRGHTNKYQDGKIAELTHNLNGRNYRHWRLGDSYRIASEKGGPDVLKPTEFAESGFDSATRIVTSTVRFNTTPRTFGRIDVDQSHDIRENRYAYWLDGKPDHNNEADFLIRCAVDQFDHSKIEAPVNQDNVRFTFPWQPPWSNKPLGTRELILDPRKGFLPIEGMAHLEVPRSDGSLIWRSEEFFVEASRLVGDVWMPTKLKEQIRASSTGPDHIAVWETEVTKIGAGTVTADDLIVLLPEGTEVVDALQGMSFVVGPGGDRSKLRPLLDEKARQRAIDALVGKSAPEFPEGATWLNSKPLTWESLRGKVVVLDFWAEWCGPCRNDLPQLSQLHESREANGLTVIGIHPPGSESQLVQKVMDEFHLGYPICVDVPPREGVRAWGDLFGRFAVQAIPHAIAVDGKGNVVAGGGLQDVLLKASALIEKRE
jgi:thiol-disulfide isomerase/thioredoxin